MLVHQARLQAQCSRRRGPAQGRAPSKRWQRSAAKLGRAHAKVAAARGDGLHKLTTRLATRYGTVVVEDLVNLASLVEAVSTGTASGAGTSTPLPLRSSVGANAQGEERFMAPARCSSLNCEDGTGPTRPDKTVTATRQRVAPKPVLIKSDR